MILDGDAVRSALDLLERDGYCIVRGAIAPELVAECRAAFARWAADNAPACDAERAKFDGCLPRIINLHEAVPELARLFSETPGVLAVLDAYFGAETVLYTSIYFEHGSGQHVHRDAPYFATLPELNRFLGVWYALEDTTASNGPITAVRGGHDVRVDGTAIARSLYPDLREIPPIDNPLWNAYQAAVSTACDAAGLKAHELHVTAGDVIVWHALLPHGGVPIAVGAPTRNSLVVHAIPVGTSVRQADVFFNPEHGVAPWAYDYEAITRGRRMIRHSGPYFGARPPLKPAPGAA